MHMQKLKSRHRPYIFAKINSKMDHRPKFKMQNYETPMIEKLCKTMIIQEKTQMTLGMMLFQVQKT